MRFNIEIIKPVKASVDTRTFICKVNVINKLDQDNCEEFEFILTTLTKGGLGKLMFDLDELRYIDSSGIGKMINITKNMRALKGNVAVTRCSPNVMEVFTLVHLEKFIKIFNSNEEGISYLKLT